MTTAEEPLPLLNDEPVRPAPRRPAPPSTDHPWEHYDLHEAHSDWGPYAYFGAADGEQNNGLSAGAGLLHLHDDDADIDAGVHVGVGHIEELDGGSTESLFHVHGGITMEAHDTEMPGPGDPLYDGSIEGGALTFDAGIYDDGETFTAGATAGLAGAAMELGSTPSADHDADTSVRLGGGFGPGFAGRVHHGDADHDGIPEAGLGVDVGWFSGDVRSELIGRLWNWMTD